MKRSVLIPLCLSFLTGTAFGAAKPAELTGAGSTFVYPLIAKWAEAYKQETGVAVNYQSIGSGGGIKQIQAKTVDFGATDKPLSSAELAKDALFQFPLVNGAVVPVIHVAGIKANELRLNGSVLADIFLGNIKKWNEAGIKVLNPQVKLPDQAITVVHRADGSGTSFIWTNYLSKVSPDWKTKIGEGTAPNWPAGVGGKGNEGVASYVKQIDGSIGYVEFAYALQNDMTTTQMQNASGSYVEPKTPAFEAAAAGADWGKVKNDNYFLIMTNAAGKASWPIAGSTFILMHKVPAVAGQTKESLKFFRWAFAKGQAAAKELHYVPIPKTVSEMIEATWKQEVKPADGSSAL